MKQSNLIKFNYKIALANLNIVKQNNMLLDALSAFDKIYSYVVFSEYQDGKLQGWSIIINYHEVESYNTIIVKDVVHNILLSIQNCINQSKNSKVAISFGQPSLDVALKIYAPYINSLARKTQARWTSYEYDDLVSICQMCMCVLYNAGYYLNKALLQKSFNNYILMELRKVKNAPQFVSLDSIDENGKSYKDTIADTLVDEQQYDEEESKIHQALLKEEREQVIEVIGQRAYNELLRQYRSKVTDQNTSSQIRRLRNTLSRKGVNYKSIKIKILGE